jgi:hypothetical protein
LKTSLSPSLVITKKQDLSNPTTPLKNTAAHIYQKMLRNTFDPRSPSINIDRTPIVFIDENDEVNDITLDAENDTHISDIQISIQEVSQALQETNIDETKPTLLLDKNPLHKLIKSEEIDPRSPTVGIDRTPIAFKAEIVEEIVIAENLTTKDDPVLIVAKVKENNLLKVQNVTLKPINNLIFEDDGNIKFSTPKKTSLLTGGEELQRTPLSCLANKGIGNSKVRKIRAENIFNNSKNNLKIFMDEQENEKTPVLSNAGNKLQNSALMALSAKSKIPVFNRVNK